MRQNMKQIPHELYIAARIDGLSNFRFLLKVVIPQVKSAIFTTMLLSMIWIWNIFAWPNLVTTNDSLRLISNGLKNAFTQASGEVAYELQMAAATMVTVPLIIGLCPVPEIYSFRHDKGRDQGVTLKNRRNQHETIDCCRIGPAVSAFPCWLQPADRAAKRRRHAGLDAAVQSVLG